MPINARPEYFKAQSKYLAAKTREEKIIALEEMIKFAPKHKGTETLLAQLKSKLAKLKEQKEHKTSRKITTIPKEGDAQVCLLGLTQSGKSTFLSKVTNAKPEISDHPFTTTKPEIGCMDYQGVKIQLVEIPSTFQRIFMNIVQNSDGIVLVLDSTKDSLEQKIELRKILEKYDLLLKPFLEVLGKGEIDTDSTKKKIWEMLGLIRIYCKEPGKTPTKKPMVLKKGSTIKDAAKNVHKDFLKFFKFARVWGVSTKYQGMQFGLDHELKDGDILEIHIS